MILGQLAPRDLQVLLDLRDQVVLRELDQPVRLGPREQLGTMVKLAPPDHRERQEQLVFLVRPDRQELPEPMVIPDQPDQLDRQVLLVQPGHLARLVI